MHKFKYQTIKLTRTEYFNAPPPGVSGPYFYTVPADVFPDRNFNNIHSFAFYSPYPDDNQASKINMIEINQFKISDYEVLGERTPLKLFMTGTSVKMNDRFTEVNLPNNFQQLICNLVAKTGSVNDIYLVLRMNNVQPSEHFKNYFRYETKVFTLNNTPGELIKKFSFRPKTGAKTLKGVGVSFIRDQARFWIYDSINNVYLYTGYSPVNQYANSPVGTLSLQLNNLKSNPIVMDCHDYKIEAINRKVELIELNEPLLKGGDVEGYFRIRQGAIPVRVVNFSMYLTFKYSI